MEKWLTAYLLTYKSCPLPSVGSLILQQGQARSVPEDRVILAPIPSIGLHDKEISSYGLTGFLARQQNISINEAAAQLSSFCARLQQLSQQEELHLANLGTFFTGEEGKLRFKARELPAGFTPPVRAERVIHKDAVHNIIVGDTQTDSVAMTALLGETLVEKKKWWVGALVLAGIGVAAIAIWFFTSRNQNFGNSTGITPAEVPATYQATE